MILTILAFVIAALALGVALWILIKHWEEIRLLDPLSIKEEQHRQKREAIIVKRFERIRAEQLQPFQRLGRHLHRAASQAYERANERMRNLESFYQNVTRPFATMAPTLRERIKTLLDEGRSLTRDQKWADAERRYLEILSLDARHAEAYKGLGQIYLKQKLYPQAKETFDFVAKMKKADDATYAALAEIAEAEQDFARAETMRLKAVEASPRQAHRYAELANFYVERLQDAKAWPSAKRASDLEPSSAKYLELSLDLALRAGDVIEARRRYNRLRLLTEDRSRFQHWREKVEALEGERMPKSAGKKK